MSVDPEQIRLLPSGCIHGVVTLTDVRKMKKDDAFDGGAQCAFQEEAYVWEMKVPKYRPCRPDKIIGRLGIFEVPDNKILLLNEGDDFFNYPSPQGKVRFSNKCGIL